MQVAIMQPYFFPYLGYFSLIKSADIFVFYDDVKFIKRGWVNRNQFLINGKSHMFTLPIEKASQNKAINELNISNWNEFQKKFLKMLTMSYKRAPFFVEVMNLINTTFSASKHNLAEFLIASINKICLYLKIETITTRSSMLDKNEVDSGQSRIINICKQLNATSYINAIGGIELYDPAIFSRFGIELKFNNFKSMFYSQFDNPFVPYLSILDVLMFNNVQECNLLIDQYELING